MLTFNVSGDVSKITRHLSDLSQRQVPYATSRAINKTLIYARKQVAEAAKADFDRPTRWTLNATEIEFANKRKLIGAIQLRRGMAQRKDAIRFLGHEIYGGTRPHKRFEQLLQRAGKMPTNWYAVPAARMKLDRYGNMSRGLTQRILSDLKSQFDVLTNRTERSGKRRRGGQDYFSSWPTNAKTAHLKPGIYARARNRSQAIYPVVLFVPRVSYRKRYRYFETLDRAARHRFPLQFALEMKHAIQTAR